MQKNRVFKERQLITITVEGMALFLCSKLGDDLRNSTNCKGEKKAMNYEEFKNEFVEALQERLYERGNEVSISVNTVEKINETYEAITVIPEGSNIGMNMNLGVFAEAYENGVGFDELVKRFQMRK